MKDLKNRLLSLQQAISNSFDVVYRNVEINNHRCVIIFLSSLSDSQLISDIVESIVITIKSEVTLTFYPGSVEPQSNLHKAITALLSGQCLVLVEGVDKYPAQRLSQVSKKASAAHMTALWKTLF